MLEFLKMFGLGILYTVLLPFILAYFALFLVYTLLNYIFCDIYTLIFYFFGGGVSRNTKLEKTLQKRKEAMETLENTDENTLDLQEVQIDITPENEPSNIDQGGIF